MTANPIVLAPVVVPSAGETLPPVITTKFVSQAPICPEPFVPAAPLVLPVVQGPPGEQGEPGPPGESGAAELLVHIADVTPHPAYDDLPSLALIFENGII